jgi:hypothetical protein
MANISYCTGSTLIERKTACKIAVLRMSQAHHVDGIRHVSRISHIHVHSCCHTRLQ